MYALVLRLVAWAGGKLVAAGLIVLIALAGYALWLFLQESGTMEAQRLEKLQEAIVRRDALQAARGEIEGRIAALQAEIEAQQDRAKRAEKIVSSLRELESWWERWFGNRKQQEANAAQREKAEGIRVKSAQRRDELQQALTEAAGKKGEIEEAWARAQAEVGQYEASRSRLHHFAALAWEKTKWPVFIALAAYFLGPTLWSLAMYYAVAPLLSRGPAIRLGSDPADLPAVGESRVSLPLALAPGEILRVREKFLQSSDEGGEKRTRFVLDWRIPFTSLACGLVELIELRNHRPEGDYLVTLSNSDDPHVELAAVEVPAGGSLVLRPSFLAGVVQREGERLRIRRHWRIFRWHAWVSGQFRFFEFVGPCRLLVAGSRGVRAEQLAERAGQEPPARRTNQDATIGFTPNLSYRPVRAETFWSYYRGMNPLFDDLFAGRGVFLLQETATAGSAARAGRFWSGVWNGVLKVFGL